jgi:hypothetical protein
MRWAGHGREEKCIQCFGRKTYRKETLGRPGHGWENIKIDHKEMGSEDVDRIHLAHDRDHWRALVNALMNLQVP